MPFVLANARAVARLTRSKLALCCLRQYGFPLFPSSYPLLTHIHRKRTSTVPRFLWRSTTVCRSYSCLAIFLLTPGHPDPLMNTKERSDKSVRLLPYVLVPGMDTSSRLFHKAQATISKQVPTPTPSPPASEHKAHVDRLFSLQQGKSSSFLMLLFGLSLS